MTIRLEINSMNYFNRIIFVLIILINNQKIVIDCNRNDNIINSLLSRPSNKHQGLKDATHAPSDLNRVLVKLFDSSDCQPSFFQTQTRLDSIRSLSNCYNCRLAVDEHGRIFTTKQFDYESLYERINEQPTKNIVYTIIPILGFYMKFLVSKQYLCVRFDGQLYVSATRNRECLWYTNANSLISKSYDLALVIQTDCKLRTYRQELLASSSFLLLTNVNNHNSPRIKLGAQKGQIADEQCTYQFRFYDGLPNDLRSYLDNCRAKLLNLKTWNHVDDMLKKKSSEKPKTAVTSTQISTHMPIIKKCHDLKSTSLYKDCLDHNYKCHMYAYDKNKLKECRRKNGINVPKISHKSDAKNSPYI